MENSRKLLNDIHQLLNEGKKSKKDEEEKVEKKSKKKEEELDEGTLNESGVHQKRVLLMKQFICLLMN